MLGGFLDRKSSGESGVKTLWLGIRRLRDFSQGMEYMRSMMPIELCGTVWARAFL